MGPVVKSPIASVAKPWTTRRVIAATLVVVAVAFAFFLLFQFYLVVFTLFTAVALSIAIKPIVRRLARIGIPQGVGILIVSAAGLVLVGGLVLLVAPVLTERAGMLASRLPQYYVSLRESLASSSNTLVVELSRQLPASLNLSPILVPVDSPEDMLTAALQFVEFIGQAAFTIVSVALLVFYWTLDGERTMRLFILRLPEDRREPVRGFIETTEETVARYLIGQSILCLFVGGLALVAYLLIGLDHAIVLALLAGLFEAVPIFGPTLGAIPAILVAIATAPEKAVLVIVATIVIQQVENNLLVPRVMDKSVGVNPVVSILAIAAFGLLFGVVGALLAIPLAALIQVILARTLLRVPDAPREGISPVMDSSELGRGPLSVLRLQAQELAQDVRKQVRNKDEGADSAADRIEDMIEAIVVDLDSVLAETQSASDNNGAAPVDQNGPQSSGPPVQPVQPAQSA